MANERKFLVKTVEGEEFGPIDQDGLIRWAENGRLTPQCEVRSTLLDRWERAADVSFLRSILLSQAEVEHTEAGLLERLKRRATMRAAETTGTDSLKKTRAEDFQSAPMYLRVLAATIDGIIVCVLLTLIYLFFAALYSTGLLDSTIAFYVGYSCAYVAFIMYYTLLMTFAGQTIGQKFWGVFLLHQTGRRFFSGRIYLYVILTMGFGILSPIIAYVMPSKRTLQEIMTGTRMVRVKLIGKDRMRKM